MNKPRIIFKLDKEKDLWNYWDKSNRKSLWAEFKIPEKIKKICEGKKFEECKEELANYLSKIHNSKITFLFIESVEKTWREIEEEFFRRMNKLMKNRWEENINVYLTTIGTCPYDPDEPSFMFSLFSNLPSAIETCGHEIMHLYFHKFYWDKTEKQIGKEKTADLKEALTVLLNFEFRDLWFVEDRGYEQHKELRKFISDQWKKEKNFEKLLDECIAHLKNN